MQKNEVRKEQWEIGESLFSSLQDGKVLSGNVSEIIRMCSIRSNGNTVGKYLQRAKSMGRNPFTVQRALVPNASYHQCTYRIKLRENWESHSWSSPNGKGSERLVMPGRV
jgi:hypothetical protein